MDDVIKEREKNWKKIYLKTIKESKNERDAINNLLSGYLEHSRNFRNVKTRAYQLITNLKNQINSINVSRIDIAYKKEMARLGGWLETLGKKIKKI